MTIQKVYDLIDKLEDAGYTISEKADLLLEIMKVSGFFTQEDLQEMEKKQEETE